MACSALFDGCFLTLSPAHCALPRRRYYVLWGRGRVEKRAEPRRPPATPLPPPQTPHCEKSVGRALRARRIRRRAKCRGQAERHGVLGPGSFFPISQRLCLIMRAEGRKKSRITPMSPKVGVNRAEMSFAVVFWCSWRRSRGRNVVTNEVSGKGSFPFSGGKKKKKKKKCDFHSWLDLKAIKTDAGIEDSL